MKIKASSWVGCAVSVICAVLFFEFKRAIGLIYEEDLPAYPHLLSMARLLLRLGPAVWFLFYGLLALCFIARDFTPWSRSVGILLACVGIVVTIGLLFVLFAPLAVHVDFMSK